MSNHDFEPIQIPIDFTEQMFPIKPRIPLLVPDDEESNSISLIQLAQLSSQPPSPKSKQEFIYTKSIPNDISDTEATQLFTAIRTNSSLLSEFNLNDICMLPNIFSCIKVQANEFVIEIGDSSSFVAIILSGTCKLDGTNIYLDSGQLLGEISCFEDGIRTTSVVAFTDTIVASKQKYKI
jgi:hypothetical protein